MLEFLRKQLARLLESRAAAMTALDAVLDAPTRENRGATAEETAAFDASRAAVMAIDTEIEATRGRIAEAEAIEARSAAARVTDADPDGEHRGSGITVTSEPRTYEGYARHSYFLDLMRAQLGRGDGDGGVGAARERLARHEREMVVEMPAREARREQASRRELRGVDGLRQRDHERVFEKRVSPNRTDGQGGYFVPPLWLIDEYIDLPRFGRTTANLCRGMTLPGGTDNVNLPKVSTGTSVNVQTADGGPVTSVDLTDNFVTAPVRTIAGQQDIALQLLDQSPISFDEVVFADLLADGAARLDIQVINGSGTAGQVTGLLNVSGINAITYTDASPTLPELWLPLLQSASQVAKNRKMPPTAVVQTPSVWYWSLSQLDSTSRPLLMGNGNMYNPMGSGGALEVDGPAGVYTYGLPAYLDGNIPSNLGGGTETRVITARFDDLFLWEGAMRTRVLTEVLSGTMQVRLQIYWYVAFMANRRPEAISVISGTGVIPQSGF